MSNIDNTPVDFSDFLQETARILEHTLSDFWDVHSEAIYHDNLRREWIKKLNKTT